MFKRRRAEQFDVVARSVQERLDEQSRQLRALNDAISSLAIETAASARESRGLELLIATQLDMLRGRLAAINAICEMLDERGEIDRAERRRLTEAIVEIARERTFSLPAGEPALDAIVLDDGALHEPAAHEGCTSAPRDEVTSRWRRS